MWSLKETMQILGLERSTLREYMSKEVGLLKPKRNESNYCQYDEEDIRTLMVIQVFREIGYKRKEIKKIMNLSDEKIARELEKAREELIQKKRQITGLINYVTAMRHNVEIPIEVMEPLKELDMDEMYSEQDYKNALRESIIACADARDWSDGNFVKFATLLVMIGAFWKKEPEDEGVQRMMRQVYEYGVKVLEKVLAEDGTDILQTEEREKLKGVTYIIRKLIGEENFERAFNQKMKGDATGFIRKASEVYLVQQGYEDLLHEETENNERGEAQ